jgi:anaerobic dimethyl sulfoxide reductase subunit C (anchor subunit)
VVAAGICSSLHLTHPDRIMGALSHPTSGIFTEALLTGLLTVASIIYIVLTKRGAGEGAVKGLAAVSGILGIILPFATGMSYMMSSRPSWNTITFPLACLATTAVTGAALYLAIVAGLKDEKEVVDNAGRMTLVCGIAAAVLAIVYAAASGTIAGSQAAMFWVGVVAIGSVLPAVCGALVKKGNSALALACVAVIGSVIGSVVFRCFMWLVGTGILDLIGNGNWFSSI